VKTCQNQVKHFIGKSFHTTTKFNKSLLKIHVGLVEASIGRMVPIMKDKNKQEHPLLVVCEKNIAKLPVVKTLLKEIFLRLKVLRVKYVVPFLVIYHRKLYIQHI
jgi:hypothetical protein